MKNGNNNIVIAARSDPIEHLLCSREYGKAFSPMNSFSLYHNPLR